MKDVEKKPLSQNLKILIFILLVIFAVIIYLFLYEYFLQPKYSTTKTWLVVVILLFAVGILDIDEIALHEKVYKFTGFLPILSFLLIGLSMYQCDKDNDYVKKVELAKQKEEKNKQEYILWPSLSYDQKIDGVFYVSMLLSDLNMNTSDFDEFFCSTIDAQNNEINNLKDEKSLIEKKISNSNDPIQISSLKADLEWYENKIISSRKIFSKNSLSCEISKKIFEPLKIKTIEIIVAQNNIHNTLPWNLDYQQREQVESQIEKEIENFYTIPVSCDEKYVSVVENTDDLDLLFKDTYEYKNLCDVTISGLDDYFVIGLFENKNKCDSLSNSLRSNNIVFSRQCMAIKDTYLINF